MQEGEVKNTFGFLSQRWRIYQHSLLLAPQIGDHVVKATCALHNYLTRDGDSIVQAMLNNEIEVKVGGL